VCKLLCVMLVALLLSAGHVQAQEVKLRANLQAPIAHPVYGVSLARFKEVVEKQSKNTILIEIFDNGQLFRDEQVVDAVSSGAVEIGITAAQQFANRVPAVSILDQPFLFNFPALVRAVAKPGSQVRKLIDDAVLVEIGVRVLWWQSLGDAVFFSKGRDVADPERMKDQRVAVPGKILEEMITRCGGKPTALSAEKIPDAIRGGALDMAVYSMPALQPRGLWQLTDTITFTTHTPIEFFLVVNEKAWQSLSAGHRAILAEAARIAEAESRDRISEIDTRARAFAASKGMRSQELSPDQVAEWRACSAEMLAGFMDRNGDLARQLMDAYGQLRTDPCCTSAPGSAGFTRR
jgi:C4-dicarboxylate-binding protein DctP